MLDKGGFSGILLTDLSKAFDCINHQLLIAKLYAYGFDINSVRYLYSYLTNRKQRVKLILLLVNGAQSNMVFHMAPF